MICISPSYYDDGGKNLTIEIKCSRAYTDVAFPAVMINKVSRSVKIPNR